MARDIWHMTESHHIHSEDLLLLALLLVLLATGILNDLLYRIDNLLLRQYMTCVVDSLGLEIHVLYHCTMGTRHPDLVSFDF